MKETLEIIRKNVREQIYQYLDDRLAWDIEHAIMSGVEWDLMHMEGEQNDVKRS